MGLSPYERQGMAVVEDVAARLEPVVAEPSQQVEPSHSAHQMRARARVRGGVEGRVEGEVEGGCEGEGEGWV